MPQPYKGRRIALTVRLPFDIYTEAAREAKHRQWSISHFVAYAVAAEVAKGHNAWRKRRALRAEAESAS
jgi:hypothetical protein